MNNVYFFFFSGKNSRTKSLKNTHCTKCHGKYIRASMIVFGGSNNCVDYICKSCDKKMKNQMLFENKYIVVDTNVDVQHLKRSYAQVLKDSPLLIHSASPTNSPPKKQVSTDNHMSSSRGDIDYRHQRNTKCHNDQSRSVVENFPWRAVSSTMVSHTSYTDLAHYIDGLQQLPELKVSLCNKQLPQDCVDVNAIRDLPPDCPGKFPVPIETTGNGNCFFNSLSRLVYGDEEHATELRVRVVVEAVQNKDIYLNNNFLRKGHYAQHDQLHYVDEYIKNSYMQGKPTDPVATFTPASRNQIYQWLIFQLRKPGSECGIWQFHQAACVLNCPLKLIYPIVVSGFESLRDIYNRTFLPTTVKKDCYSSAHIMFSRFGVLSCQPDHFVPVIEWNRKMESPPVTMNLTNMEDTCSSSGHHIEETLGRRILFNQEQVPASVTEQKYVKKHIIQDADDLIDDGFIKVVKKRLNPQCQSNKQVLKNIKLDVKWPSNVSRGSADENSNEESYKTGSQQMKIVRNVQTIHEQAPTRVNEQKDLKKPIIQDAKEIVDDGFIEVVKKRQNPQCQSVKWPSNDSKGSADDNSNEESYKKGSQQMKMVTKVPSWYAIIAKMGEHRNYNELETYVKNLPKLPVLQTVYCNKQLSHDVADPCAERDFPEDCPVNNPLPVTTIGNGNCLFNALSRLVYGDQAHAIEMRVRLVVEAVMNKDRYLNNRFLQEGHEKEIIQLPHMYVDEYIFHTYRPINSSDSVLTTTPSSKNIIYKILTFEMRRVGCEGGIWQFHQAAAVLRCPIRMIYPPVPHSFGMLRHLFNRTFMPDDMENAANPTVHIMFSRCGVSVKPNHFVPVVERLSRTDIPNLHPIFLKKCASSGLPTIIDLTNDDNMVKKSIVSESHIQRDKDADGKTSEIKHIKESVQLIADSNVNIRVRTEENIEKSNFKRKLIVDEIDVMTKKIKTKLKEVEKVLSKDEDTLNVKEAEKIFSQYEEILNVKIKDLESVRSLILMDNDLEELEIGSVRIAEMDKEYKDAILNDSNIEERKQNGHCSSQEKENRKQQNKRNITETEAIVEKKRKFDEESSDLNEIHVTNVSLELVDENLVKETPIEQNVEKCGFCERSLKKLASRKNIEYLKIKKPSVSIPGKICTKCCSSLTSDSTEDISKYLVNDTVLCVCCDKHTKQMILYDKQHYNFDDPSVKELLSHKMEEMKDVRYFICINCHLHLLGEEAPSNICICCKRNIYGICKIFKKGNFDFNKRNVQLLLNETDERKKQHICTKCCNQLSSCKTNDKPYLILPKHIDCVACHHHGFKMTLFLKDNYKREPLMQTSTEVETENQFICHSCDFGFMGFKNLQARAKFRKECKEFPEHICTVCHRCLFFHAVREFDVETYDVCDKNVELCLNYRCKGQNAEKEYICEYCHGKLRKEMPSIPDIAVANDLQLPVLPDPLMDLKPMERRCLSANIPFMVIQSLRKGGQKKINGPCVNVPADMGPIAKVLPRIPEHLQFVLLKLKRRLVYKSNYMYDYIRPTKVMNALVYLKAHNPYYKNVIINDRWYDEFMKDDEYNTLLSDVKTEGCHEENEQDIGVGAMLPVSDVKTEGCHEENEHDIAEGAMLTVSDCHVFDEKNKNNHLQNGVHIKREINTKKQSEEVWNKSYISKDDSFHGTQKFDKTKEEMDLINLMEDYTSDEADSNSIDDDCDSEDEFVNEQLAADRKADITVEALPTCIQEEYMDNLTFTLAPCEGNKPKHIIYDKEMEYKCFSDYFPLGRGGYFGHERKTKLDLRRYLLQRLQNKDARFAGNDEYVFAFQYACELQQLEGAQGVSLRMTRGSKHNGSIMNAGMMKDNNVINDLVRNDKAYKFMKDIRGTPAFWQQKLYDTLAMMKALGTPTWFLTLSPAEFMWPDFIQAVGRRYGLNFSDDDVSAMSWDEKAFHLRRNPVITVQMFDHRLHSFFADYMKSEAQPLGEIVDYIIKIEFQARGSPHAHCLLWVNDSPVPGKDDDEKICKFVDRYCMGYLPEGVDECTCEMPDDVTFDDMTNLAEKLQSHVHSLYCKKHKNKVCRFGFPKLPSPRTIICWPTDEKDPNTDSVEVARKKAILKIIQDMCIKEKDDGNVISLNDLLKKCCISEDEYIDILKSVSSRSPGIILKREPKDGNINNFNPNISSLWRANMDVQYVLDPYSAITYILSYVMKPEKGMSELIRQVAVEYAGEGLKEQMKMITRAFTGKREVSQQEALYRCNRSFKLFEKSRTVQFISSSTADKRTSLPKPKVILEEMDPNDDDIFMASIHDRYERRPDELENMCLAQFGTEYEYSNSIISSEDTIAMPEKRKNQLDRIKLKLKQCTGVETAAENNARPKTHEFMKKTRRPKVLRTYTPKKGTQDYFCAQLLLFTPYRNENEFGNGFASMEEHYRAVEETIKTNAMAFNLYEEEVERALDDYQKTIPQSEAGSTLDANTEESQSENVSSLSKRYRHEAKKDTMTWAEYCIARRTLNSEQREIVNFNRRHVKQQIADIKAGISVKGYKIFLNGPGGTGKSHVINLINRDTKYLFSTTNAVDPRYCENRCPNKPTSLLTAFTGTAAFNICGSTLSSTMQLCLEHVSDQTKTIMKMQLSQIQLIIIDEISMVGLKDFNKVNSRCCMIKNSIESDQNFGDINMLVVGDFNQLPPVMQTPVYRSPANINNLSDMQPLLWRDFEFHEFTQVMRQKDEEFALLLNSIRLGPPKEDDYADNMLKARELNVDADNPAYPKLALHVYAQNIHCRVWNEKILDSLTTNLYESQSHDTFPNAQGRNITLPDKPSATGNLQATLLFKVGSRVVLTDNMDVLDGLTNGAYGTIIAIIPDGDDILVQQYMEHLKGGNTKSIPTVMLRVKYVLVKFDSPRVGQHAREVSPYRFKFPHCVPIPKITKSFKLFRGSTTQQCTRQQFPIFLAWAVTIHKVQGMTLDELVVDMHPSKGRFTDGQAYVAFSRVRMYNKLHILNYCRTQIKTNKEVAKEMDRLRTCKMNIQHDIPCTLANTECLLKLGTLNINGLQSQGVDKSFELQFDPVIQSLDILCLVETHLSSLDILNEKNISKDKHYAILRNDRVEKGGGVMLAINTELVYTPIYLHDSSLEIIGATIRTLGKCDLHIFCIYLPPLLNKKNAACMLSQLLHPYLCDNCIVTGDFNENIIETVVHSKVYSELQQLGFNQCVHEQTTIHATLLDHLYAKGEMNIIADVSDTYYSDHDLIAATIDF